MAVFMALAKYSPDAAKGVVTGGPAAREAYLRQVFAATGSTVIALYFVEGGEWDLVVIADLPDVPGSAVATYLTNQGAGLYENWRGYRLYSGDDVQAALAQTTPLAKPGS